MSFMLPGFFDGLRMQSSLCKNPHWARGADAWRILSHFHVYAVGKVPLMLPLLCMYCMFFLPRIVVEDVCVFVVTVLQNVYLYFRSLLAMANE